MAVSEELIVRIRGDLRDIETKLNRLERESGQTANTMARQFQQAGQRMGRAFAALRGPALAAGAAATGLGLLAQRSLEATENMVDLANRANVSTTFLQRMRFAASQNGASMRDFDDAAVRLNRRLGLYRRHLEDSNQAAGPAGAAFESLGLRVRIASGELDDTESVFNAAVLALQRIEDHSSRAAVASQLFGDDAGPRLVTMLAQGEEGLRAIGDEFERLGGVMSDEVAQNAATASAEIRAMQQAFTAQTNAIIAEHADELVRVAEALTDIASAALQAAAALGGLFDRFARTEGGRIALDPLSEEERDELIARARTAQDAVFERTGEQIGRQAYAQVTQALGQEALDAEGITLGVRSELNGELAFRLGRLLQMRIDELEGFEIPSIGTGGGGAPPSASPDPAAQRKDPETMRRAITTATVAAVGFGDELKDVAAAGEEVRRKTSEIAEEIDRTPGFTRMIESAMTLEDALVSSLRTFEDTLVDAITEGKLEFDDLARHILRTFARMAVQQYITGPIARFASAVFGAGPGKATGGPASGMTLVGEQGPELVNLGPMANVMTANMTKAVMQGDMRRGGSGGPVSINNSYTIDARGADAGAESRIRQAIQEASAVSAAQAEARTLRAITSAQRNRRAY